MESSVYGSRNEEGALRPAGERGGVAGGGVGGARVDVRVGKSGTVTFRRPNSARCSGTGLSL